MTRLNMNWLTSKAWMSGKLSLDWFNNFVPEVQAFCEAQNICFNILLLLNNTPGHSPLVRSAHPNIRVEFLPPNTTSLIQPMDMEIISCVKAAYSRKQFRRMRFATEDENAEQMLVDSEEEEDQEEKEGGGDVETEAEQQVKQYWRAFNVKEAIDLIVKCWGAVTPATINHAWRNVVQAEEARRVAGRGFDETTEDDIRVMLEPVMPTAEDIMEEGSPEAQPTTQPMSKVREIIDLRERLTPHRTAPSPGRRQ
ncbi:tigger transposable element-derived protein 1-like [Homarus americanus]|uniref:tigger transposable element-derived protein 1-like n=1 Tax=Homarus americanus TaxID=6706 RepID=UPI001C46B2A2|nr:tigger transposable element-derived protein 1-like [Homarus americanus]